MNIAKIKPNDISNGDGVRVSVFVSGCRFGCKGCFNQEAWDFNYGEKYDISVAGDIIRLMQPYYISGVSILGGEPLDKDNRVEVLELVKLIKSVYPNKTIWLYTGYDYELVRFFSVFDYVDVCVDGRFIESLKVLDEFRGSSNQRIIDVKKSKQQGGIILYEQMG